MARLHGKGFKDNRKRIQTHKSRIESVRNQRLLIMIACEGEKTERYYFESFLTNSKHHKPFQKHLALLQVIIIQILQECLMIY